MSVTEISANQFQEMVQAGANRLQIHAEYVNSLNVFPVPDGDTGTNMNLSMTSGAKAVIDSTSDKVGELAALLSKGLLMGARGNSGVILSQLFRGFSKQIPDVSILNAKDLASAFIHGVETAYKAVMKPVEGTILTVAREAAKAGEKKAKSTDDVVEVMTAVVKGGKRALEKTPDLLPVLKEVGVVDSGGQGLLFVYEGFLNALNGGFQADEIYESSFSGIDGIVNAEEHHCNIQGQLTTKSIHYGYCTEILVKIGEGPTVDSTFDYEEFRNYLDRFGDSLLVVYDDKIIKVHVHTEHPGEVLNYGQKFGSLVKIKVDNMRLQHEMILELDKAVNESPIKMARVSYGIIAIAAGAGIQEMFESLGVNYVISGGQTMNPSTEDIVKAIQEVHAEKVIVLPNNKNIFMAANQAAEVSEIPVAVVPSKTISQGLIAMLSFNDQVSLEENKRTMTEMLSSIISGQVTHAIRDTTIDGVKINEGDFLGMIDGKIIISNPDIEETLLKTLEQMIDEQTEIVTILAGEGGSVQQAESFTAKLVEKHPDLEIEIHQGDQPIYPYLFSAE